MWPTTAEGGTKLGGTGTRDYKGNGKRGGGAVGPEGHRQRDTVWPHSHQAREVPPFEPRVGEPGPCPTVSTRPGLREALGGPLGGRPGGGGASSLDRATGPLGEGMSLASPPAEGPARECSPGTKSPSPSPSESSGQDSGVEPLLSVAWLWPEGWSLALRSRRSGPGPCGETEALGRSPPTARPPSESAAPSGRPWRPGVRVTAVPSAATQPGPGSPEPQLPCWVQGDQVLTPGRVAPGAGRWDPSEARRLHTKSLQVQVPRAPCWGRQGRG